MALPHLPTTYTTRKNIYESAIVQRRNKENDSLEKWNNHANYFQKSNVTANKKQSWESAACFNGSMDAYQTKRDQESKRVKLQNRRLRLTKLLADERNQLEAELRDLTNERSTSRLDDMKNRSDCLKTSREEKRKNDAELRLYDHWKSNNPYLRKVESDIHQQHVIDIWREQLEERRQHEEVARLAREEQDLQMEMARQAALQLEQEKQRDRLSEERHFKQMLIEQMSELRERERQAEHLKSQEEVLVKQQWELESLESLHRQQEADRKKLQFGKVLLRQHAAALRRRSQQVQKELEEDQRFLEALVKQEEDDKLIATARRETSKADAAWMKQVVDEQLKLEQARETELDMMYHDEAARIWEKRQLEWERERNARQRLMQEVLDTRQGQIEHKMATIREQQQESLQQREELVRELEAANQMTRLSLERDEREKEIQKREFDAQISSRREHSKNEELMLKLQLDDDRQEEEDYHHLLEDEAARMTARGYQPTARGRKQAWM